MFWSGIEENPDLDLQAGFDSIFDDYPSEFRAYWGLDDQNVPAHLSVEEWEEQKRLSRLASRIAELAETLARPPKLRDDSLRAPLELKAAALQARKLLHDVIASAAKQEAPAETVAALAGMRVTEDVRYRFFSACLQLELREYLVEPRELAERTMQLTQYAARVRGERALQYLARVSQCYLYNMKAELAVMGRATLEALLEEEIPEAQVRTLRRIPSNQRTGLSDYLQVAQGTLLEGEAVQAAWRLKQFGDDAVHVAAEAVGDPEEILENLVQVLKCLESRRK